MLKDTDPLTVLDYIRSSVEMIMSMKFNGQSNRVSKRNSLASSCGELAKEYEDMVQKMEEEIRNHVRVEQQLKLLAESVKLKLEDANRSLEAEKERVQTLEQVFFLTMLKELKDLKEKNEKQEQEINKLNKELQASHSKITNLEDKTIVHSNSPLDPLRSDIKLREANFQKLNTKEGGEYINRQGTKFV